MAKKVTKEDLKKGDVPVTGDKAKTGGTILQRKITMKPLQKMPVTAKARVAGIVTRTELVTTPYGDSVRIIGSVAMVISDDDGNFDQKAPVIRAGAVFLPKAAEGIISGAIASQMNEPEFKGVEFSFEIGKEPNEKSKTGYEWTVKTLIDTVASEDKVLLLLGA